MYNFLLIPLLALIGCGSSDNSVVDAPTIKQPQILITPSDLVFSCAGEVKSVRITSTVEWKLSFESQNWCTASVIGGHEGETSLKLAALKNTTGLERTAVFHLISGDYVKDFAVKQSAGTVENYVPEGYTLVWQDEFNASRLVGGKPAMPHTSEWWYETGNGGWGNNELENYVAGVSGVDTCAVVTDGSLKIIAKKRGNEVLSIRMNTQKSWTYGYFEARLKLPQGRGAWPAFWMLPKNFVTWPNDGEIDIMEEVGYRPNWVASSIHCQAYNHGINTPKTAEKYISTAESDFHIYAVEWTAHYIKGYVDGECYFTFDNDQAGRKETWPFNVPFYLKLNLAWGGNWGGAQGVDETKLPLSYEIDYVRVYQKK